jgi:hypothetical protein
MIGGAVFLTCFGLMRLEKHLQYQNGLEKGGNVESQREFPEEKNRATLLDIQERIVEDRIDFSRRVAQEIIAERLSLWEAARQLENLDQCSAPVYQEFYQQAFRQLYPGHSLAERYCRRAIALVDAELVRESAKRAVVLRRLNQELRAKFNNGVGRAPYWDNGV